MYHNPTTTNTDTMKNNITAAERKSIKAEIAAHKRDLRSITTATQHEIKNISKLRKQLDTQQRRAEKALAADTSTINRRLAILQGRL
jgi:hypothetical protein